MRIGGIWRSDDSKAILDALGRALAIIEFDPSGTILRANENFCHALGYELGDIVGKHHRIFVAPRDAESPEYRAFWERLGRGEFDSREYKRIARNGDEVWIQASYNPVFDAKGRVLKIVKAATVVTEEKLRNAEYEAKLNAISLVQAVIEFHPTGEIIRANDNFLNLLGYRLDEIVGKHHRIFCDAATVQSPEYAQAWDKLNRGEFVAGSFKRIGKSGKEVWIQASYNPVFDLGGRVMKVVKFATDITDLTEIGAGLGRLADNNLDHRIDRSFTPAFEKLRADFNTAHDSLAGALTSVVSSARAIRSGTGEISQAADDLSKRTEQQAASLEETAAALDEITATVRKTSEGANHARAVVSSAKADAEQSGEVVRKAVAAMSEIERSAGQISNIIGVIDEIAFQTNLLALNAGVEAARAGEAGRGFAVVASEVRALAQRSADAAKEIKGLIQTSSTQVASGVTLVGETGQALTRILTQVSEINGIVTEIAASAQEQATGLQQVNTAVNQMDQVTQQNAAMVEESTAASHSLAQETDQLVELIGRFRVGRGAALAPSPIASAGRPGPRTALKVVPARGRPARAALPPTHGNLAVKQAPPAEDGWEEF